MADTSTRIRDITRSSGYEVDVAVKDGLTGNGSSVHADVESLDRLIARHHICAQREQQFVAGRQFIAGEAEVVLHMPPWDHKRVALCHRVRIEDGERKFVLEDNSPLRDRAERALGLIHLLALSCHT